jgi:hypothetical protein
MRVDLRFNLAVGALTSPHFNVRVMMPLLLGATGAARGFADGELGELGAAYSAGATLVALSSVLWLRSAVRFPLLLFQLLGLGALAAMAGGVSFGAALAAYFAAGIGCGGAYALVIALISRSDDPDRAVGWQWCLGTIPGVVLLLVAAPVAARGAGLGATVALLALANLAVLVALPFAPARLPDAPGGSVAGRAGRVPAAALVALFAVFAFYVAATGAWSFLGRIATDAALPAAYAGAVFSAAAAVSALVGLVVAELGVAGERPALMAGAVILMLAGFALVAGWPTRLGFAVGVVVSISLTTYALSYAIAMVPRLDVGARASGLPAAALGLGSIAGPATAGQLYQHFGTVATLGGSAATLVAGFLAYAWVQPRARHAPPDPAGPEREPLGSAAGTTPAPDPTGP